MFIVIEMLGGPEYAIIVTDTEGNNKVFEDELKATAEAEECQNGVVVEV